jgi:hypothetical protein
MRKLMLSHLRYCDVEVEDEAKVGDFVIEWFRSPVSITHNLPNHNQVNMASEAEGLVYLFNDDSSVGVRRNHCLLERQHATAPAFGADDAVQR